MTSEAQIEVQQSNENYGDEKWLEQYRSLSSWSQLGNGVRQTDEALTTAQQEVNVESVSDTAAVCV